ncbi:phosphohydrolase [Pseudomonas phage 201phi2-1]|uniref:Putative polyphosphate hydrolase n=1 Tax=Pseudomonas phage 201phi2-1 TaxID=198110 RepID=B3FJI5_BP201|nr:phosphohydrolase [Pseudomonas phage 201phi2-1]ABY63150.1 putative polyphosphate hydrolase [Pseudomonas phage 201phi2-1]
MREHALQQYTILDVARAFSVAAHCAVGQKRKYSGEDYFHHPEEVLQILLTYEDPTLDAQVAALLHDVVEDTQVKLDQVNRIFGRKVAMYVEQLTEVSKPGDGNREARKALDLKHLELASHTAMCIKCADLISNSRSIVERDLNFARTYLVEKLRMLKAMEYLIGGCAIWSAALEVCYNGIKKIWTSPEDQLGLFHREGFTNITMAMLTQDTPK